MNQVYVAMPLVLKDKNHEEIVESVYKKFIHDYPQFNNFHFFNPFKEITQEKSPRKIMDMCFEAVKKSDAVLYIMPSPTSIDETLTLGAVSECDLGLKLGNSVFGCVIKNGKVYEFFEITSIDDLLEKFKLKAPCGWLKIHPELNISKKYRAKKDCGKCIFKFRCDEFLKDLSPFELFKNG